CSGWRSQLALEASGLLELLAVLLLQLLRLFARRGRTTRSPLRGAIRIFGGRLVEFCQLTFHRFQAVLHVSGSGQLIGQPATFLISAEAIAELIRRTVE